MINPVPFSISRFSKLHDIKEDAVKESLTYCIHYATAEGEKSFITESGMYTIFLNQSLFSLIETAKESWHLINMGYLSGTNKLLVGALATRCGWDGKSVK